MDVLTEVLTQLQQRFPDVTHSAFRGQTRVWVSRGQMFALFTWLQQELGFDLLVDITCVDYLQYRGAKHRFGMVYLLARTESATRLTVRVPLDEPDLHLPSLVSLWAGADWLEREVWDLFGIRFDGHPDLRRIVLPEAFAAHPLRKDYPLQGRGERHNFPVIRRGQA
jgi:NADH-quinone oxidoreductase subunit C